MSGRKAGRAYGSSSRVRASVSGMPVIIQSRAPLLPKIAPKTNLQNSVAIGDAAKRGDAASDDQSSLKADPKKSAQALNLMMSPVVKSDDEEEDEMELENVEPSPARSRSRHRREVPKRRSAAVRTTTPKRRASQSTLPEVTRDDVGADDDMNLESDSESLFGGDADEGEDSKADQGNKKTPVKKNMAKKGSKAVVKKASPSKKNKNVAPPKKTEKVTSTAPFSKSKQQHEKLLSSTFFDDDANSEDDDGNWKFIAPSADGPSAADDAAARAHAPTKRKGISRLKPRRIAVAKSNLDRVLEGDNEEASIRQPALPPGWVSRISKTHNRIFYFHEDHGSSWIRPTAHVVKRVVAEKGYGLKNNDYQSVSSLSHSSYGSSDSEQSGPEEKEPVTAVAAPKAVLPKSGVPEARKAKAKPLSKPQSKSAPKGPAAARSRAKKRLSTSALIDRPKRPRTVKKVALKGKDPAGRGGNEEPFDFGAFEDNDKDDKIEVEEDDDDEGGREHESSENDEEVKVKKAKTKTTKAKVKVTKAKAKTTKATAKSTNTPVGSPGGVFGRLPVSVDSPTPLNSISRYYELVARNRRREKKLVLERNVVQTQLHPKACKFKAVYRGGFIKGCTLQALVADH